MWLDKLPQGFIAAQVRVVLKQLKIPAKGKTNKCINDMGLVPKLSLIFIEMSCFTMCLEKNTIFFNYNLGTNRGINA